MSRLIESLVVVRGAGDLATGTIARLLRSGFPVIALETEKPSAIRRSVAFAEAVYEGEATVEGIRAALAENLSEALELSAAGVLPLLVDPRGASIRELRPASLVDAIIAKRNLGTSSAMAPLVVALGPGFSAPGDAHAVVETNRGHALGRVILEGSAEPDTGVPGQIGGKGAERVVHAPASGRIETLRDIGDLVEAGEPILAIRGLSSGERTIVRSPLDGILRGLIRPGFEASEGLKIADVDPRCERENCFSISDKALAIAGGVLEALLSFGCRPSRPGLREGLRA
jgi:xanthine dehydrogenase accessory factor